MKTKTIDGVNDKMAQGKELEALRNKYRIGVLDPEGFNELDMLWTVQVSALSALSAMFRGGDLDLDGEDLAGISVLLDNWIQNMNSIMNRIVVENI